LAELKIEREKKAQEMMKQQTNYQDTINKIAMMTNPQLAQQQINEQSMIIQQLMFENNQLKEQVKYLSNKIKQIVADQIQKRKEVKVIELPNDTTVLK
jgi:hypothetical protein